MEDQTFQAAKRKTLKERKENDPGYAVSRTLQTILLANLLDSATGQPTAYVFAEHLTVDYLNTGFLLTLVIGLFTVLSYLADWFATRQPTVTHATVGTQVDDPRIEEQRLRVEDQLLLIDGLYRDLDIARRVNEQMDREIRDLRTAAAPRPAVRFRDTGDLYLASRGECYHASRACAAAWTLNQVIAKRPCNRCCDIEVEPR